MTIVDSAVNVGGVTSMYAMPSPVLRTTNIKMMGNCRRRKSVNDLSISCGERVAPKIDACPAAPSTDRLSWYIGLPRREHRNRNVGERTFSQISSAELSLR